jgi:hypothetical protein
MPKLQKPKSPRYWPCCQRCGTRYGPLTEAEYLEEGEDLCLKCQLNYRERSPGTIAQGIPNGHDYASCDELNLP